MAARNATERREEEEGGVAAAEEEAGGGGESDGEAERERERKKHLWRLHPFPVITHNTLQKLRRRSLFFSFGSFMPPLASIDQLHLLRPRLPRSSSPARPLSCLHQLRLGDRPLSEARAPPLSP